MGKIMPWLQGRENRTRFEAFQGPKGQADAPTRPLQGELAWAGRAPATGGQQWDPIDPLFSANKVEWGFLG